MSSEIKCTKCGTMFPATKYYFFISKSDKDSATGLTSICKNCVYDMLNTYIKKDGLSHKEAVKKICEKLDKPYIEVLYNTTYAKCGDSKKFLGTFFKNCSMKQWEKRNVLTYKDSIFDEIKYNGEYPQESSNNNNDDITPEMIKRWGSMYSPEQILKLEDIYQGMKESFTIENRSQEEYLKAACLYQLKNIEAIAHDNSVEADKWGKLFDKYMDSGKLKPNQLSAADMLGNVTTFSEFYEMVEKQNGGIIPKFPDVVLDDIDYSIFCFINYNRDLLGYDKFELGDVKRIMNFKYEKGQEIISPSEKEDNTNGRV